MAPKAPALRRPAAAPPITPTKKTVRITKTPVELGKPAAVDAGSPRPTDVEVDGQIVQITPSDHKAFLQEKSSEDPAILEDARAKADLGYGKGKQLQLNKRIAAWKLNGWDHPMFKEVIKYSESMPTKQRKVGMGYVKAKQYWGGPTALKEAIESKECVFKKIDGRDWHFDSAILADLTKELKGDKELQRFTGDAIAGFYLGGDAELSDDMMRGLDDDARRSQQRNRNPDDDDAEKRDFDAAVDRARNALKNTQGLRNKSTELEGDANAGSAARKSNVKKTIEKGKEIDELIKGYQDLARTKALPGLRKTTAECNRKKFRADSKIGNKIVAMILAVQELGD
ncbi:unnamed protein product [Prorocentrum cordatum]|uniref:Uncharacterized protein n=1 Tax=Prorocentrum cordatum TaxID=2364126 RepID=A0ABN9XIZ6_9DINO|nr:unnamed protein product [Polarella glacialis]